MVVIFVFGAILTVAVLWDAWIDKRQETAEHADRYVRERRRVK